MIIIEVLNNSNVIPTILNISHRHRLLWPVILISWIWFCANHHILNSLFINGCGLSPNITWILRSFSIIDTIDHRFHSNPSTNRLRAISISLLLKLLFQLRLICCYRRHVLLCHLWHWRTIKASLILNFRKLPWVAYSIRINFLMVSWSIPWT